MQFYPISHIPIATSTNLGLIQLGDGLTSDANGVVSIIPGGSVRSTKTLTTSSLAVNANLQTSLVIANSFHCLQIATDKAARVRFYNNAAYQAADVSRALDVDPSGNHGVLLEVITSSSYLTVNLSPILCISTLPISTTIPITITNLSGSTSVVNVNILVIPIE